MPRQRRASRSSPSACWGRCSGDGPGTVEWSAPGQPSAGTFALSPKVGDQIAVSIFYDQNGHTSFTATDITQGITKTARVTTGSVVHNAITLVGAASNNPPPPAAAVEPGPELRHLAAGTVTSTRTAHRRVGRTFPPHSGALASDLAGHREVQGIQGCRARLRGPPRTQLARARFCSANGGR
jgi:hypothetical protein